jgi:beta propeller repeat protein
LSKHWLLVAWGCVVPFLAACGDDSPGVADAGDAGDGGDAWVLPDVAVGDARVCPDVNYCEGYPEPEPQPEATPLFADGPHELLGGGRDGRYVVYADFHLADPPGSGCDVFLFDLPSWTEQRLTSDSANYAATPAVSGTEVIWSDYRDNTGQPDDWRSELYHFDINTGIETRLTDSPEGKSEPLFDASHIIYMSFPPLDESHELRLLNRLTGDSTTLSDVGSGAEGYSLGDRYVTWVAWPADPGEPTKDVYYYDLLTGVTTHLPSTGNGSQYSTSVDGHRVVWMDNRRGNWDIFSYNTETEEELLLTDDPSDQVNPWLAGDLLVFRDYRFTCAEERSGCASDVAVLDLQTGVYRRVTQNSWHWGPLFKIQDGLLLINDSYSSVKNLYLVDLRALGVLDPTGLHVEPQQTK